MKIYELDIKFLSVKVQWLLGTNSKITTSDIRTVACPGNSSRWGNADQFGPYIACIEPYEAQAITQQATGLCQL